MKPTETATVFWANTLPKTQKQLDLLQRLRLLEKQANDIGLPNVASKIHEAITECEK